MNKTMPKISKSWKGTQEIYIKRVEMPEFHDRIQLDEEHVEKLRESIARHGLMVPLMVRELDGKHILIAGAHRLVALNRLGISKARADVYDVNDEEALTLSTVENEHRKGRDSLERLRALLHQTFIIAYRLYDENNMPSEIKIDSLPTQAQMINKTYFDMKRGSTDELSAQLLLDAFRTACENFVVSEKYAIGMITVFDLPPALLVLLREEKISMRAGMEASKWYKKLRGRAETPKSGTRGKEREDALTEFAEYIISTLPNSEQIAKKGAELLMRVRGQSSKAELEDRFETLSRKIADTELSPKNALALDTLLKKIEKLISKG